MCPKLNLLGAKQITLSPQSKHDSSLHCYSDLTSIKIRGVFLELMRDYVLGS